MDAATTDVLETTNTGRPKRKAAMAVQEKISAITTWENVSEDSEIFKQIADQIDSEMGREKIQRVTKLLPVPDEADHLYESDPEAYEDSDPDLSNCSSDDEQGKGDEDEYESDFVVGDSEVEYEDDYDPNHESEEECSSGTDEDEDDKEDGDFKDNDDTSSDTEISNLE